MPHHTLNSTFVLSTFATFIISQSPSQQLLLVAQNRRCCVVSSMSACVARAGQHKFCGRRVLTLSFSVVDGKQDRRPAPLAADSLIPPSVSLRRMKSVHKNRLSFQSKISKRSSRGQTRFLLPLPPRDNERRNRKCSDTDQGGCTQPAGIFKCDPHVRNQRHNCRGH